MLIISIVAPLEFTFPNDETISDFVSYEGPAIPALSAFTACAWVNPGSIEETFFVSYAVSTDDNAISFEIDSATTLGVTINNSVKKLTGFSFTINVEVRICGVVQWNLAVTTPVITT